MDNIKNYTVIDLEMTGLSAKNDKIIEIGCKDKEWRTVRKIPDTCRSKDPYSAKSAGTDGDN